MPWSTSPTIPGLVLLLGQALFATGKYDEAAGAVQHGLSMLPQDKWGVVVSNYSELYRGNQDYTDQLRALEAARKKTNSPALQFLLGYQYGFLGYPKEAVRELDKGIGMAPGDVIAKKLRDYFAAKLPSPPACPASAPAGSVLRRCPAPPKQASRHDNHHGSVLGNDE